MDEDKLNKLRNILSSQLEWYKEMLIEEEADEIDGSYIYDTAYERFNDLSRGDFQAILEILTK